jgi:hypothetical protein
MLALVAPKFNHLQPDTLQPMINKLTYPFFLEHLHKFCESKDKRLGFTDATQAQVTQLLWDGQKNVGYFTATGE